MTCQNTEIAPGLPPLMTAQRPLDANAPCPCGHPRTVGDCCQPIHAGIEPAKSAEALMRSRYSAHVVLDVDYLLRSWRPKNQQPLIREEIEQWARESQWLGLTIHTTKDGRDQQHEGWVEFSASFVAVGESTAQFHREHSYFVRDGKDWFYVDGRHAETGRNESCPCGSGKKYKRCCAI